MARAASLTPMLRHYLEVKAEHPDALLFYRMGDFYELFFEDAQEAAALLEVTLTARQKGTDNEAPMCGVPHHALGAYLKKAIRAGRKVAICDQVEDPATAKGLVRREVTRVVTPGTLSDPDLLEGREENLLAALAWEASAGAIAFLDVSTGRLSVRRAATIEEGLEALELRRPAEVLWSPAETPPSLGAWIERHVACRSEVPEDERLGPAEAQDRVRRKLGVASLAGFGLGDDDASAVRAVATALAYAERTQRAALEHVRSVFVEDPGDVLILDPTTLANLDVLASSRHGGRRGSLLAVLDKSATPPGGRAIREWLRRPLRDRREIASRHQAVRELADQAPLRERLRQRLTLLGDPERLLARAVLGTLTPREAGALRNTLRELPALLEDLATCQTELLRSLAATDPAAELAEHLATRLTEEPPPTLKDGGVIATGVDGDLDRCRSLARDQKKVLLALEREERDKTGVSSLKIKYNRVFGYFLEVTKANVHLVPSHYVRKQTLANAERYVTPELQELEEAILTAEERQLALETELFAALVIRVAGEAERLSRLGDAIGRIDALASFAEVAAKRDYVVPRMDAGGGPIRISGGRHPVVEAALADPFVPNDVELDESSQIVVLTGPNMGGKSTYLRQVALLVLMAQAGSLVPAESAEIGIVDRIFTRVGASDDIARGESTFMVEMIETARILHHATAESLVILDEVGRGTATFDGLSLAWAIVEHLHEHRRPKTLFATHYHELTELAGTLPRVVNRTMAVKEWQDQILFLRRVTAGSADKSYGLHVARLAGLPGEVLSRAAEVLANLEEREIDGHGRPRLARGAGAPPEVAASQLALFTPVEQVLAAVLAEVDVDQLTPLAALNLVASLKDRLSSG